MAEESLVDDLEAESDEEEYEPDPHMVWIAEQFSSALLAVPEKPIELELGLARVRLAPGIRRPIQYSDDPDNLLSERYGYTALVNGKPVELSLQLYETVQGYYRLFAFVRPGILFSVNLTLGHESHSTVRLAQQLRIGSGSATDRRARRDELVQRLRALRFDIDENNVIDLGDFDPETATFQRTTAERFLKDFLTVALLKGHFMGNKRYSLEVN